MLGGFARQRFAPYPRHRARLPLHLGGIDYYRLVELHIQHDAKFTNSAASVQPTVSHKSKKHRPVRSSLLINREDFCSHAGLRSRRNPHSYFHVLERRSFFTTKNIFCSLAVASAASARRNFARWREQYRPVRERLAQNSNASIAARSRPGNKKKQPWGCFKFGSINYRILVRLLVPMKPESTEPNNHTANGKGTGETCSHLIVKQRRPLGITQTS
jgi:hypothetical protein